MSQAIPYWCNCCTWNGHNCQFHQVQLGTLAVYIGELRVQNQLKMIFIHLLAMASKIANFEKNQTDPLLRNFDTLIETLLWYVGIYMTDCMPAKRNSPCLLPWYLWIWTNTPRCEIHHGIVFRWQGDRHSYSWHQMIYCYQKPQEWRISHQISVDTLIFHSLLPLMREEGRDTRILQVVSYNPLLACLLDCLNLGADIFLT